MSDNLSFEISSCQRGWEAAACMGPMRRWRRRWRCAHPRSVAQSAKVTNNDDGRLEGSFALKPTGRAHYVPVTPPVSNAPNVLRFAAFGFDNIRGRNSGEVHGKAHILRREGTFVAVALLGACQKIKCPSTAQSFENAFLPWPIARLRNS